MSTPDVVLAPGMLCDRRLFEPQIEAIEGRVSVADLTRADSIAGMAKSLLDSAPTQFALAGLSLGGIVALECVRLAPERITHLALLDTTPLADTQEKRDTRTHQIREADAGHFRDIVVNELKPGYLATSLMNDSALRQLVIDMAVSLGPDVFARQSTALMGRRSAEALLPDIAAKTLVLCGEEDRLCPVALHQQMAAAIPDAQLMVIPDCGHLPTLERPDTVCAAILAWLNR
ncbi:MAG: alpha/beta hydrolase [Pseudomonadota bacterium]